MKQKNKLNKKMPNYWHFFYFKINKVGDIKKIYSNPIHPYTKSLLSTILHVDPIYEKSRKRIGYDPKEHDYDYYLESKKPI